jgi:hypothetical protein
VKILPLLLLRFFVFLYFEDWSNEEKGFMFHGAAIEFTEEKSVVTNKRGKNKDVTILIFHLQLLGLRIEKVARRKFVVS